jgi:hypothetical protein
MKPKNFAKLFLVSLVLQVQACGDDKDLLSEITCQWKDPVFCNQEGELRLKNKSSTLDITRLYIVRKCSTGWGGGFSINMAPDESATFTRHYDKQYDIKAEFSNGDCDIRLNREVPPGGVDKVTLRPNQACDITATNC